MDLSGVDVDFLTNEEILKLYNNFLNMDESELIADYCFYTSFNGVCGYCCVNSTYGRQSCSSGCK